MSEHTKIGWTDHTFNPWWGCVRVSAGCVHCYAEALAARTGHAVWGPGKRRLFGDKHWAEPMKWNEKAAAASVRRRVFCGSMCDVFEEHDAVRQARQHLWWTIDATPALDWLLLTKRPENIARMLPATFKHDNVWLGTSVENQAAAEERIPHLLELRGRARVLFLSIEPLIGKVDLGMRSRPPLYSLLQSPGGIGWVIVGGESGQGYRPMEPMWMQMVAADCDAAGVPLFVKQDSHLRSGRQGRIPEALWARKEFPR